MKERKQGSWLTKEVKQESAWVTYLIPNEHAQVAEYAKRANLSMSQLGRYLAIRAGIITLSCPICGNKLEYDDAYALYCIDCDVAGTLPEFNQLALDLNRREADKENGI